MFLRAVAAGKKGYCVGMETLGMATGWWPSSKPGPLTPPPSGAHSVE